VDLAQVLPDRVVDPLKILDRDRWLRRRLGLDRGVLRLGLRVLGGQLGRRRLFGALLGVVQLGVGVG
jgi:hypothetical protein